MKKSIISESNNLTRDYTFKFDDDVKIDFISDVK